ncbi:MAG: hypothetical protein ACK5HR_04305, partial [Mycoplasmatales bacterium]
MKKIQFKNKKSKLIIGISILGLAALGGSQALNYAQAQVVSENMYSLKAKDLNEAQTKVETLAESTNYTKEYGTTDFKAHYVKDTDYIIKMDNQVLYGQGYYMEYEGDHTVVYCVDPLTGAQTVINKDTLTKANNTTFATLTEKQQQQIKKIVKVTNNKYQTTQNPQYLVAGQMLVWEQSGAEIQQTSATLTNKMTELNEDVSADESAKLNYYDTKGQDLVGEIGTDKQEDQDKVAEAKDLVLTVDYQEDAIKSIKNNQVLIKLTNENQVQELNNLTITLSNETEVYTYTLTADQLKELTTKNTINLTLNGLSANTEYKLNVPEVSTNNLTNNTKTLITDKEEPIITTKYLKATTNSLSYEVQIQDEEQVIKNKTVKVFDENNKEVTSKATYKDNILTITSLQKNQTYQPKLYLTGDLDNEIYQSSEENKIIELDQKTTLSTNTPQIKITYQEDALKSITQNEVALNLQLIGEKNLSNIQVKLDAGEKSQVYTLNEEELTNLQDGEVISITIPNLMANTEYQVEVSGKDIKEENVNNQVNKVVTDKEEPTVKVDYLKATTNSLVYTVDIQDEAEVIIRKELQVQDSDGNKVKATSTVKDGVLTINNLQPGQSYQVTANLTGTLDNELYKPTNVTKTIDLGTKQTISEESVKLQVNYTEDAITSISQNKVDLTITKATNSTKEILNNLTIILTDGTKQYTHTLTTTELNELQTKNKVKVQITDLEPNTEYQLSVTGDNLETNNIENQTTRIITDKEEPQVTISYQEALHDGFIYQVTKEDKDEVIQKTEVIVKDMTGEKANIDIDYQNNTLTITGLTEGETYTGSIIITGDIDNSIYNSEAETKAYSTSNTGQTTLKEKITLNYQEDASQSIYDTYVEGKVKITDMKDYDNLSIVLQSSNSLKTINDSKSYEFTNTELQSLKDGVEVPFAISNLSTNTAYKVTIQNNNQVIKEYQTPIQTDKQTPYVEEISINKRGSNGIKFTTKIVDKDEALTNGSQLQIYEKTTVKGKEDYTLIGEKQITGKTTKIINGQDYGYGPIDLQKENIYYGVTGEYQVAKGEQNEAEYNLLNNTNGLVYANIPLLDISEEQLTAKVKINNLSTDIQEEETTITLNVNNLTTGLFKRQIIEDKVDEIAQVQVTLRDIKREEPVIYELNKVEVAKLKAKGKVSLTITGLTPNTNYSVGVIIKDKAGNNIVTDIEDESIKLIATDKKAVTGKLKVKEKGYKDITLTGSLTKNENEINNLKVIVQDEAGNKLQEQPIIDDSIKIEDLTTSTKYHLILQGEYTTDNQRYNSAKEVKEITTKDVTTKDPKAKPQVQISDKTNYNVWDKKLTLIYTITDKEDTLLEDNVTINVVNEDKNKDFTQPIVLGEEQTLTIEGIEAES